MMSEIGEALDAYAALVVAKGFVLNRDSCGSIQDLPAQDLRALARWPSALSDFYAWSNGAEFEKDGQPVTFGFFVRFCSLQEALADFDVSATIENEFEDLEPLQTGHPSQALFPAFNANSSGNYWYGCPRNMREDCLFVRDLEGDAETTGMTLVGFVKLLHRVLVDPSSDLLEQLALEPDDPIAQLDLGLAFDAAWRAELTGVLPETRQSDEFYAQQAEAAIASVPREMLARIEQLGSKGRDRAYKLLDRIGLAPCPTPATKEDLSDDET